MAEETKRWDEAEKLCPLKGKGEGRECDKDDCQFWYSQYTQCMVKMYLRAAIERGGR